MNNANTVTSSCLKESSCDNDESSDYNFQMGLCEIGTLTKKYDPYYYMNHRKRGVALIFYHCVYDLPYLDQSVSTEKDVESLTQILKSLGFLVLAYHDLTVAEIRERVKRVSSGNHTDFDCFAMFVLTRGDRGFLYARDEKYLSENLWVPFSSEYSSTLTGKPKLFFIQTFSQDDDLVPQIPLDSTKANVPCSSDNSKDKLVPQTSFDYTEADGPGGHDDNDEDAHTYTIPSQADFLIVCSTMLDFYANKGSWFTQAFCEELENNAYNYDILRLLTCVIQKVSIEYDNNVSGYPLTHKQNQIPCVITRLTRLLKFNRKR